MCGAWAAPPRGRWPRGASAERGGVTGCAPGRPRGAHVLPLEPFSRGAHAGAPLRFWVPEGRPRAGRRGGNAAAAARAVSARRAAALAQPRRELSGRLPRSSLGCSPLTRAPIVPVRLQRGALCVN